MPVRSSQPQNYPGGRALIEVTGPAAERVAEPVEICIVEQSGGSGKTLHLDPRTPDTPWKNAVFWFAPASPRRDGPRFSFDLEHGVTFHLRPHRPYVLRLKAADGGAVEEMVVWKPIRGRSERPEWTPPQEPAPSSESAAVEPEPALRPEPPRAPELELKVDVADRAEPKPPAGSRSWILVTAAALLLAVMAGGGWFLMQRPPTTETGAEAKRAAPTTVQEARRLVLEGISPERALEEGLRSQAAGALDGAFLLLRHAAEKGNATAAVTVGAMYDPDTYSATTSPMPAPNPDQAASWYRRAAEAGDAEAQYRLGRVLKSERTQDPDGPGQGVAWLQKAAAQGHAQAREALGK